MERSPQLIYNSSSDKTRVVFIYTEIILDRMKYCRSGFTAYSSFPANKQISSDVLPSTLEQRRLNETNQIELKTNQRNK